MEELVVVVGDEIYDVFAQVFDHCHSLWPKPGLGVSRGSGPIVEGTKVSVPIHHGNPHTERLGQTDQGVINRAVTVRVEFAHHIAHNARRLHVALLRSESHLRHLVDDSTLHRFQAISRIGECPRVNH